ncbi:MAG TPA: capsule biosynthesis protein CapK [Gammaproteobacteria bacterium]|nr:capsule biosynthesis protein CapK [Gammaproteobacteria bacterium]
MLDKCITGVIARGLFPLQEHLKGHHTVAARRFLEQSQWWSASELHAYQNRKLSQFMQKIVRTVPYYRLVFEEKGLKPEQIQSIEDLQLLPFLTKSIIRSHHQALIANEAEDLSLFNTGGSTGEPLQFYLGKERITQDVAAKWRATRWWDVDIGDREIVVWGSPIEVGAQDRMRGLRDRLFRSKLLSAFELSQSNLAAFVQVIQDYKPKMLFGYPSALAVIAEYARTNNIKLNDLGIKVAFVTSEKLYPDQEKSISEMFNCPVANGYGGRDAGFIAHACPSGGMHITAEDIIVEIINDEDQQAAPGELGEIVVTHLATGDYPFVRYRTGDLGILDSTPCECGRGLPVLKAIQGRTTDFLYATDGSLVHALALIYVLRETEEIAAFKIVQVEKYKINILYVSAQTETPLNAHAIEAQFKKRLGSSMEFCFKQIDVIEPGQSGKMKYVENRLLGHPN